MNNATRRLARTMAGLLLTMSLVLPTLALGDRGELVSLEEAAEVSELSLRALSTNRATIYASICDQCRLLSLQVTESTEIRRGGRRLTLQEAERLGTAGATVLFTPDTLEVTRILYWQ